MIRTAQRDVGQALDAVGLPEHVPPAVERQRLLEAATGPRHDPNGAARCWPGPGCSWLPRARRRPAGRAAGPAGTGPGRVMIRTGQRDAGRGVQDLSVLLVAAVLVDGGQHGLQHAGDVHAGEPHVLAQAIRGVHGWLPAVLADRGCDHAGQVARLGGDPLDRVGTPRAAHLAAFGRGQGAVVGDGRGEVIGGGRLPAAVCSRMGASILTRPVSLKARPSWRRFAAARRRRWAAGHPGRGRRCRRAAARAGSSAAVPGCHLRAGDRQLHRHGDAQFPGSPARTGQQLAALGIPAAGRTARSGSPWALQASSSTASGTRSTASSSPSSRASPANCPPAMPRNIRRASASASGGSGAGCATAAQPAVLSPGSPPPPQPRPRPVQRAAVPPRSCPRPTGSPGCPGPAPPALAQGRGDPGQRATRRCLPGQAQLRGDPLSSTAASDARHTDERARAAERAATPSLLMRSGTVLSDPRCPTPRPARPVGQHRGRQSATS